MSKVRQSNFELLRIIIIFLIILHHSIVHGLFISHNANVLENMTEHFWLSEFASFGKIAVYIFIMISGYFLVNSKYDVKKHWKKLLNLLLQIYFYSIGFYILGNLLNINVKVDFKMILFPIGNYMWWFATVYVFLYLIYPYLNIMIKNMKEIQFRRLVFILLFIYGVMPLIYHFSIESNWQALPVFILSYLIGAYFKLYTIKNDKFEKRLAICVFVGILILTNIINYLLHLYSYKTQNMLYADVYVSNIFGLNSIFALFIGTSLFVIFKHLNITNKFINTVASTTFGIYLIHDNVYTRELIWNKIINVFNLYNTLSLPQLLLRLVLSSIIIFIICSIIDYIRIYIFKIMFKICNWIKNKIKVQLS